MDIEPLMAEKCYILMAFSYDVNERIWLKITFDYMVADSQGLAAGLIKLPSF